MQKIEYKCHEIDRIEEADALILEYPQHKAATIANESDKSYHLKWSWMKSFQRKIMYKIRENIRVPLCHDDNDQI